MPDTDFDDWLENQLSGGQPAPAPARRRPPAQAGRPLAAVVQLLVVALAAGAVILGVSTKLSEPEIQLGQLSSAPALPATTFGGTPPAAPADAKGASPEATTSTPLSQPPVAAAPAVAAARPQPPPGPPASAAPAPAPAASPATFNMIGGTATVSCSSGQPVLAAGTPKPGFEMETGTSDGGATLEVRFKADTHESRLQAWCAAGAVQGQVQESTS